MRPLAPCLIAFILAASPALAQDAMFRADPGLSGVTAAPPPRGLAGVRFRFRAEGPIRGTPVFARGTVFFGSDEGHFYAVDSRSGRLRWRFEAGAGVASSPSVSGGLVCFTAWDGTLYALNAATGAVRWKAALGRDLGTMTYWDFYTSSPTPLGTALYVGSGDGHVYAFDRATGRRLWAHDTGARVRGTPAVTEDAVVVGTMDGHVVALDRRSGAARWSFATEGAAHSFELKHNDTTAIPASPTIHDGLVTIGARDGNLYALDLATGARRWQATHDGGSWILSTAMQGSTVFSGSGSAYIIQSAKAADGSQNWRSPIDGAAFGPIAVAGDVLVADDLAGMVHAFDTADGHELWRFPLGDRSFAGPLVADGAVFAASDNGTLVALDTTTIAEAPPPRLLVYAEPNPAPDRFEWFQSHLDRAVLASFASAHYTVLDDAALKAALEDQAAGRASSAIVFADGHLPPGMDPGLLRRFLDGGGVAVFVAHNPLALHYDKDGAVDAIDDTAADAALGYAELDRRLDYGYHVSRYTPEGERWGLSGDFVTSGALDPAQVSVVLARDRVGYATAWAKAYPKGGLLLQVPVALNRPSDLAPVRAAIELAIAHGPGR